MSAYMVSDDHIHALINFAVREKMAYRANGRLIYITEDNAEEVGQKLVDENYRSVNHRYEERTEGHFGKPPTYKFKRVSALKLPSAVTMIKLCHCYDYQACETEDWSESVAWDIIDSIKDAACRKLPGYDAAPWGI